MVSKDVLHYGLLYHPRQYISQEKIIKKNTVCKICLDMCINCGGFPHIALPDCVTYWSVSSITLPTRIHILFNGMLYYTVLQQTIRRSDCSRATAVGLVVENRSLRLLGIGFTQGKFFLQ